MTNAAETDREGRGVSRRAVLLAAAAAAGTVAAGRLWHGPLSIGGLAASTASAADLGRKYLEEVPEEADPENLERLLAERLAGAWWRPLRTRARERIQQDFRDGDVVTVDRWQLSRTEARLYALAALL